MLAGMPLPRPPTHSMGHGDAAGHWKGGPTVLLLSLSRVRDSHLPPAAVMVLQ
jgi:hypothetical protein